MIRPVLTAILAIGLLACSAPSAEGGPDADEEDVKSLVPDLPTERSVAGNFETVLAEYRQMNDRLDRVSAPLRSANASLCAETFRDPGFRTHTLEDYPEQMRGAAQALMGVEPNAIYVRSVRRDSPAEKADIQTGDRILRLGGQGIPGGRTMTQFYDALSRGAFDGAESKITLRTPAGHDYETSLQPQTACDYQTTVFYSQDINGYTDGREVYVTSELMRNVPDDVNLALIVAHEMAHAIAGHLNEAPTRDLELEADRMALVLMDRAGYDIETAIAYWADAAHPHRSLQDDSDSHPTIIERYENFRQEQARIRELKRADQVLEFN
ncbi:M48 family metalloprotease [Litorimonas haliclonae]|uniref:M48 family metalloprotease n=1 Tax=Litorimonas haliclonae TaxID=2081977 RepID=UPI0039EE2283